MRLGGLGPGSASHPGTFEEENTGAQLGSRLSAAITVSRVSRVGLVTGRHTFIGDEAGLDALGWR